MEKKTAERRFRQKTVRTAGIIGMILGSLSGFGMDRPRWGRAERFERIGSFTLNTPAGRIFPLLCPVEEYKWLPDWSCKMFYSVSGVAEKDAIFQTRESLGLKVIWTVITYEPDSLVEYLLVSGKHGVIRLSISLKENTDNTTQVTWRMLFTSTSRLGKIIIKKRFSEENFQEMIEERRKQLDCFLQTGKMIRNQSEFSKKT